MAFYPSHGHNPGSKQQPAAPVLNPPVPFLMALPPIKDGLMVVINGYVNVGANRFHVNFSAGPATDSSVPVAFHFNPRFEGTNQVVRNSFQNRSWGHEEKGGPFPFMPGNAFECLLLVTTGSFKVAVNGQHYCDFVHRMAMQAVSHLAVDGDVTLHTVRVHPPAASQPPTVVVSQRVDRRQKARMQMGAPPPYSPSPAVSGNMVVPYKKAIPNGLRPGSIIQVSGIPTGCGSFAVNMCYHQDPSRDIALHFNPRLNEGTVVMNTMSGSAWGNEERIAYPLFFPQQHFDVLISTDNTKYTISVNGQRVHEYRHRLSNLHLVRFVCIRGDVILYNVMIH